jgi:hypothetical protein
VFHFVFSPVYEVTKPSPVLATRLNVKMVTNLRFSKNAGIYCLAEGLFVSQRKFFLHGVINVVHRPLPVCDVTRPILVRGYQRFGTLSRFKFQGSRSPRPPDQLPTFVTQHPRRSKVELHSGGSLKPQFNAIIQKRKTTL